MFDVSIVLTVHDEAKYLRRTLRSLEGAALHARGSGFGIELVVVLDRPSEAAAAWMGNYDPKIFAGYRVLAVDHSSPWPSRREGADASHGEYVVFCNAGELASYNMLTEMRRQAGQAGRKSIITPEYGIYFGESPQLVRYFGSDVVPGSSFIKYNPYPAFLLIRRDVFLDLATHDSCSSEDSSCAHWRFNCDALSQGCEFITAPGTIVFSRDKENTNANSAARFSSGQPGYSLLFEPKNYLASCSNRAKRSELAKPAAFDTVLDDFLNNPTCMELIHAVNHIDPAVHMEIFNYCHPSANADDDTAVGEAYFKACELTGSQPFTDVFLLPFLTKGGADKVIISIIEALNALIPDGRILIACGETFEQHSWLERLPVNTVFMDLTRLHPGLPVKEMDALCLRIIQVLARDARLHLKPSHFAFRFFRRFHHLLTKNTIISYRFSNYVYKCQDRKFVNGYFFNFVSDHIELMDRIITDNEHIIAFDCERIDCLQERWQSLNVKCDPLTTPERIRSRSRAYRRRLLWASRLDHEKRPEMLLQLARKMESCGMDICIDIYGTSVLDDFPVSLFGANAVLRYQGPFDGFGSIDHDQYDGFIYTTSFDGLPNVILEALSAGLPVIAPDVGGISRAVLDGRTGYLLSGTTDDEALAEEYVQAITRLYADPEVHERLRLGALELVREGHGQEQFNKRLAAILGLGV